MESLDIYKELFGDQYFKIDIDPSYDLNVIKDVMIRFSENELEETGIEFDAFKWSISELIGIILGMFNKYNSIKDETSLIHLLKFVVELRTTYNEVPYHTFRHASDVCFVTYYMFTELRSNNYLKYSRLEVIAMFVAALGHDMHHPGYNNLFQINTKSELAIKYNGKSVLEQYSADCLVELIEKSNILEYLNVLPNLNDENFGSISNSSTFVNDGNNKSNSKKDEILDDKNISHRFDDIEKDKIIPKEMEDEFNQLDKEVNDGSKTAEEVNNIKREKIKKFFCDLIVEVILSTDMSTHFQLQDELANISLTLNPSNDCLFPMENDVDNINGSINSDNINGTLNSLTSGKDNNGEFSSQMAVYEDEELIHMDESNIDKNQAETNTIENLNNSNSEISNDKKKNDAFDYSPESLSGYGNFDNYTTLNQYNNNNDTIIEETSDSKRISDLVVYQLGLSLHLLERKQYQLLSEKQRRTILNGLLHAADISNAARPWYVCEEWSNRVVEEFWRQGDEEKRLNLTVSPNMDRDRFERNGISIAFNDFITTPFYDVIYDLIPTFEIFVKLLHVNRQKWNELISLSNTGNSEPSIINALGSNNNSVSELSLSISNSFDDVRPVNGVDPNAGRRLSIAAGTLIIPDNFLSKISLRNEYQRSLSVQSDHYPKCVPPLNMSRVSSSLLALNDSNSHINEYSRSRSKERITDKILLSQSPRMKKYAEMNASEVDNSNVNTGESIDSLDSTCRNRRCQSVDTTYTRNT